MPRTMFDSVTAADIPSSAKMVAGYVDGAYAWSDADWQRFRGAALVRITVLGTTLDADVADVETGDLTPDQGGAWVAQMLAAKRIPTLYFSASRNAEIDAAVAAHGVGPDDGWLKWVANWTGVAPAAPYGVAEQYANPTYTGAHYDLSVVRDYWPGVDPAPASLANRPASLGTLSDAQLVNIFATSSNADVITQFGQDGYNFMSALYHHWPLPTPGPVTGPPPPPAGPPLDQARAAWARLGNLVINDAPAAVISIEAAITKIRNLP